MTAKDFSCSRSTLAAASTADIVARARWGEEAAFRALFEAHKRRVYSLCLRMTCSTAEAEDLTQEVFLRVFRKIATFRGESTFFTWLHRLTINVVLMHLRKSRLQQVSLDEIATSQDKPITRQYGDDDRRLIRTIDRIILNQVIADLPSGYRTALVLFDLEGYEHHEIADMMKCSVGSSKSQLHKARSKLRESLRLHDGKCLRQAGPRRAQRTRPRKASPYERKPELAGLISRNRHFDQLSVGTAGGQPLT